MEENSPSYTDYIRKARRLQYTPFDQSKIYTSFASPDAHILIPLILGTYGVVVVTDVLAKDECDHHMEEIVGTVTKLSDGVSSHDLSTWTDERLMPQVKPGVFACGIGNSRPVWDVRTHPNVKDVYSLVYGTTDLVPSIEMINVRPPISPYHDPTKPDWAHTDNHKCDKCVQGQIVLSDTTACFVCSPKSHLICPKLVGFRRDHNINSDPEHRAEARKMVEAVGGAFQIPIIAPRGSIIIWLSSTLHSAKLMDEPTTPILPTPSDPWLGWRCVIYLAYRPRIDVKPVHIDGLRMALEKNLTTRHTGDFFKVKELSEYPDHEKYTDVIQRYYQQIVIEGHFPFPELTPVRTPELAYEIESMPE